MTDEKDLPFTERAHFLSKRMNHPFSFYEKQGDTIKIKLSKEEIELLYTEGSLQVLDERKRLITIEVTK